VFDFFSDNWDPSFSVAGLGRWGVLALDAIDSLFGYVFIIPGPGVLVAGAERFVLCLVEGVAIASLPGRERDDFPPDRSAVFVRRHCVTQPAVVRVFVFSGHVAYGHIISSVLHSTLGQPGGFELGPGLFDGEQLGRVRGDDLVFGVTSNDFDGDVFETGEKYPLSDVGLQ